ncbi:hypothetical protein COU15_03340 [Candidatus Kaiserbacteria bacterium CG10_big_fil_rev_8_21_14_0_10_45_20]|uniref:Glycosyltransferase 2-like domain-containing protein n=1 Tax=Candidatus Kaiserbacteria bacterium CG10_big_fil_rev_8_21_14_0_10_45_20 TaxID=1974607 RepID=A0A2H0UEX2_9BACT|nr:MAG: hypothetical protein COU15_03340 [Candidatus Kaiserbacteria bacterium CG10_big_fil_rev_8_21_14_0_10_45_20]
MSVTNTRSPYLHIGRASELRGRERAWYRFLEMLPAILSIGTLVLLTVLSFVTPHIVAYFTICFSAYWLLKSIFLSIHLTHNFRRLRHHMTIDWVGRLKNTKYDDIVHMVLFPFYQEPYEVIAESIQALSRSRYNLKNIVIVLAVEERAGEEALRNAQKAKDEFGSLFLDIAITVHPAGVPGEVAGKGSNIAYATPQAVKSAIDTKKIPHEKVLVSSFDIDTVVYPDYFACLTWHFLTAERPLQSSFQPIPLFNNNIWRAPMLSRVLAYSTTFWQMIQQERPERLSTFSSHTIPLPALEAVGFWQNNMVNEDSRIYWNLFMHYDGEYDVIPIAYPVSMDANVAGSFWGTIKNLYKQHRRWSYGAENIPYIIFNFAKNSRISFVKKARVLFVQIEGFWSLVTQPLILFAVGWLPLFVGGAVFNDSILSYNLPKVSSWFLTTAMLGLIFLALYASRLVPPRPDGSKKSQSVFMVVQWILVPITMVIFSSIPGLDAQIRLALGKYMGFWVTPKDR